MIRSRSSLFFVRAAALAIAVTLPLAGVACRRTSHAAADAQTGTPKIEVPETAFDFGTVTEGEIVKHVFVVKNVGSGTLVLERTQTTCGCTAAILKNKEIPPGQTGEIEVSFNTRGKVGNDSKAVTIISNDKDNARAVITIKAQVEPLLGFDPRFVMKTLHYGSQETLDLWLIGKLADSAKLAIEIVSGGDDISGEVVTSTEGEKPRQGVRLTFKSKKIGNYQGSFTVTTGLEKPPKLTQNMNWSVVGNLDVAPREIFWAVGPGSTTADEQVIKITSRVEGFKINTVKISQGPFAARLVESDAGKDWHVRVGVADRDKLESTYRGAVEIHTNDAVEPKITVPITVMSAGRPVIRPPILPHPK